MTTESYFIGDRLTAEEVGKLGHRPNQDEEEDDGEHVLDTSYNSKNDSRILERLNAKKAEIDRLEAGSTKASK